MDFIESKIRWAEAGDAGVITHVMTAARDAVLPHLRTPYSRDQVENWMRNSVLKNCRVWVVEVHAEIVGFMALAGEELEHLYIHPNFWSKGMGSRLLNMAKEQSPKLRLYTFQRNAKARRFYESHGFKLISLGDGSGNEEREPDARYEWVSPILIP